MNPPKTRIEPKSVEELTWDASLDALGHCIVDPGGRVLAFDSVGSAWLGVGPTATEDGGRSLHQMIAVDDLPAALAKVVRGAGAADVVGRVLDSTGASIGGPVAVRLDLLIGPAIPSILATIRRVEPAPPSTTFDALTQLPDRRAIADRVDAWRRAAAPAERPIRGPISRSRRLQARQ